MSTPDKNCPKELPEGTHSSKKKLSKNQSLEKHSAESITATNSDLNTALNSELDLSADASATVASFDAKAFLKNVTRQPGVYRMLDEKEQVIYVGKQKI